MINLNQFLELKENNQFEVKEAKNGLPNSLWETYSAFANSYGGTILLGISKDDSKHLYPCGLTEN